MTEDQETRIIEALTEIADKFADNPRVRSIVADAIQKLMDRPCKPHWWAVPVAGYTELRCEVCNRRLAFAELTINMRSSIVNGYERRHGRPAGAAFRLKLYDAEKARSDGQA